MGINSSKINIQNGGGLISGSTIINDLTGSLFGTSSYAVLSVTSSYSSTSSYTLGTSSYSDSASVAISASYAESASYAISSSYATNSSQSLTSFTASYVNITGSGVSVNYFGNQIQLTASVAETGLACYSTYTKYALDNPSFPTAGTYAGTTYSVGTEGNFTTALSSAVAGDIISLTANIDLTATLVINKSVKVVGNGFSIQTPATSNTIATAVSVTADNVWFDSTLTIKQRKTNNTSVDVAVAVDALGFVSQATIEFMEFGYVLRGTDVSFNISGTTKYTGALGNNHRHIAIYTMTQNSVIDGVVFDFPQETTARANSIVLLYSTAGDVKTATLKVANTTMTTATYGRQFFLIETLTGITVGGNFGLIFDNNNFNDLNGGIGILSIAPQSPLNYLKYLQVTNNIQGSAAAANYKGLVFLDGSGAITAIGNTAIYYDNNLHPTTLRADYSSAIDNGGIAFENTTLSNPLPIAVITDCEIVNNALEYASTNPTASSSVSASYALTASFVATASTSISSSYAITASYALNGGGGTTDVSTYLSSSWTGSATSQFSGTASYALEALSASWAPSSTPTDVSTYLSSSWTGSATSFLSGTASYAQTSSFAITASYSIFNFITSSVTSSISASYSNFAETASYALTARSSSFATTASRAVSAATASYKANAEYLTVVRTGTNQNVATGTDIVFNTIYNQNGIAYNNANGQFTLQGGQAYKITCQVSIAFGNSANGTLDFGVVEAATNTLLGPIYASPVNINATFWVSYGNMVDIIVIPPTTQNYKIRVLFSDSATNLAVTNRSYLTITKLN